MLFIYLVSYFHYYFRLYILLYSIYLFTVQTYRQCIYRTIFYTSTTVTVHFAGTYNYDLISHYNIFFFVHNRISRHYNIIIFISQFLFFALFYQYVYIIRISSSCKHHFPRFVREMHIYIYTHVSFLIINSNYSVPSYSVLYIFGWARGTTQ